ncbi:MAG: agmatinase, partial [Mesorhizobium sp.]
CLLDSGNHQKTPGTIEREAARILKSGAFLLSLGGDHFVTWPLLKAHAAIHGPLALVQFDAHQDTWPDDGKRIDHGSFVGRAVKEGIIDPDRSIQVGIRTHAPDTFGIKILYGHEVEEMRASDIAYAIVDRTGGRKTYLTFDIDCLDPAFAPGTGTPEIGGLTTREALEILRGLKGLNFVGGDVVEVAPQYDATTNTAHAGAQMLFEILSLMVFSPALKGKTA